jgi:hypothetical protein
MAIGGCRCACICLSFQMISSHLTIDEISAFNLYVVLSMLMSVLYGAVWRN